MSPQVPRPRRAPQELVAHCAGPGDIAAVLARHAADGWRLHHAVRLPQGSVVVVLQRPAPEEPAQTTGSASAWRSNWVR